MSRSVERSMNTLESLASFSDGKRVKLEQPACLGSEIEIGGCSYQVVSVLKADDQGSGKSRVRRGAVGDEVIITPVNKLE